MKVYQMRLGEQPQVTDIQKMNLPEVLRHRVLSADMRKKWLGLHMRI